MKPAVHFPSLPLLGNHQGQPVQTGPAHVVATQPAKRLPPMPLVAPTDNIHCFPR